MWLSSGSPCSSANATLRRAPWNTLKKALQRLCVSPFSQAASFQSAAKLAARKRTSLDDKRPDLLNFLFEVVFVDPLDLVTGPRSHTNTMANQQSCELRTVDCDDL